MIARAFFHISKQSPEPAEWLVAGLNADSVELSGVGGGEVNIIATKGEQRRHLAWSGSKLLDELERTASDALSLSVAWLLLCYHDVYYDTDFFLRDYVKNVCGLELERVPFFLDDDCLVATCAKASCEGKPKSTKKIKLRVDRNQVIVLIPLSSPEIRDLFFGRLRRIGES